MHLHLKFADPCVALSTKMTLLWIWLSHIASSFFDSSFWLFIFPNCEFCQMCNIYANQLVIKVAIAIISSDKFSRSYDDLYLVGTFMRHRVHKCSKKQRQILRHINKIIFRASSCRPTFSSFFSSFFSFSSCIVAVLSHPIVTDYIIISWKKKNNFNHSISR